jgi:hypothetical protein
MNAALQAPIMAPRPIAPTQPEGARLEQFGPAEFATALESQIAHARTEPPPHSITITFDLDSAQQLASALRGLSLLLK